MYIPSYQIHNVLDVYRKQLSQGSRIDSRRREPAVTGSEHAGPPEEGSRQAIIDRVAAEIVDRIVNDGIPDRIAGAPAPADDKAALHRPQKKDVEFTYTTIDANDRKIIQTLSLNKIGHVLDKVAAWAEAAPDGPDRADTGT
jgi:hypothetical protein